MPAYVVAHIVEVHDPEAFADYRSRVADVVERHGGTYLAGTDKIESLQGNLHPLRTAIVEFSSMEQGRRWFAAEDYRELRELLQRAASSEFLLVSGED